MSMCLIKPLQHNIIEIKVIDNKDVFIFDHNKLFTINLNK